jgi:hypothetical protein
LTEKIRTFSQHPNPNRVADLINQLPGALGIEKIRLQQPSMVRDAKLVRVILSRSDMAG